MEKLKTFCWSCGKSLESCICGKEQVILEIKEPSEILPVCTIQPDFEDLKGKEIVLLPRTCCVCGKTWKSKAQTIKEWRDEKCPNCGAK